MNHDSEKWLDDRISEDVDRMADKRIDELMNSEELKDIEATEDQLQSIRRRLGLIDAEDENDVEIAEELTPEVAVAASNDAGKTVEIHAAETDAPSESTKNVHRPRIRLRAALAAALVAILVLGVGMVGSGKKVYLPVVSQREDGDESTTKVNNSEDAVASSYDEEEVCQEIEDKLGICPIGLGYKPKEMELQEYQLNEDTKEVVLRYVCEEKQMHIYISKDYAESSINFKVDGTASEVIKMLALRMDVPVYQYEDSENNTYYHVSFEYLNTYYSISGLMDKEEFKQILENIYIKNV